jgi:hypothetical protein
MLTPGTPHPAPPVSRLDFVVALALLGLVGLLLGLALPDGLAALEEADFVLRQGAGCLGRPGGLC